MQKSFRHFLALTGLVLLSLATFAPAQTQTANAPNAQPQVYTESDLPPGTLAGLTDEQKETVLKVLNTKPCTCGCSNDTIAKCRMHDPTCGTAPKLIAQTIEMAKSGKNATEIGQTVDVLKAAQMQAQEKARQQAAQPVMPSTASYITIRPDDPVRGPKLAKVTIIEFSDFQCPFCGRAEPTIKQIMDTYKTDVRLVWKHQPLSFHPNAMPAAEAAEAAREQGKFWEMHDLMFAHQTDLSSDTYSEWAGVLHLDLDKFKQSIATHANAARIKEDSALGVSNGATGTPTFFINGQLLVGALPFDNFKQVIDAELVKADALLKTHKLDANFYKVAAEENAKNSKPLPAPGPPPPQVYNVQFRPDDPMAGPRVAKVTIVEFSDFQCPFCGRVEPTIKQIKETYGDNVRFIWKHQPLAFHPNAMPAAEAAEAAREQGKFWEMHDLMFAHQPELSADKYQEWAKQIGLNLDDFNKAIASHQAQSRIQEDITQGQGIGAAGTPTFFINGRQVIGALPFEAFKNVIDEEVSKADALIKSGHPLDDKFYQLIVSNNVKDAAPKAKPSGTN